MKTAIKSLRYIFAIALYISLIHGITHAEITKGPYIQRPTRTTITIMWESDNDGEAWVQFGETREITNRIEARLFDEVEYTIKLNGEEKDTKGYLYQVKLSGLTPGSTYFYRVEQERGNIKSNIATFRTHPEKADKFTFIALGDSRTDVKTHNKISAAVLKANPDFIISMGDLVTRGHEYEAWKPQFFEPMSKVIDHIPFWSTLGDHDTIGDQAANFRRFFHPDEDKYYFSFDYGNAHFVSLDYRLQSNEEMINWLKEDLSQSKATWKFVYNHRPSYNIGGHRCIWGQKIYPKIYQEFGVDMVISGHSHIYERFYPLRPEGEPQVHPVTYITTGGAGAGLYDSPENIFLAAHASKYHYIVISIDGNKLNLVVKTHDGNTIDSLDIRKEEKEYNKEYMAIIKDQTELDLMSRIAVQLGPKVLGVPGISKPASVTFKINGEDIPEDINLSIGISEDSADSYRFPSNLIGILKAGDKTSISGKLYAIEGKGVDKAVRGDDLVPPLYFKCTYTGESTKGIVYSEGLNANNLNNRIAVISLLLSIVKPAKHQVNSHIFS